MKRVWIGYIPEDGHWPIPGTHSTERSARAAFRRMLQVNKLPSGSWVVIDEA